MSLATLPVIVLAGPTASGKTELALSLAQAYGAWILSADSRMVYKGLDIGSGKPTWEHRTLESSPWTPPDPTFVPAPSYLLEGVRHFGLDVVAPGSPWTLADWLVMAQTTLRTIDQVRPAAIVVGGTGLYLKALIEGYVLPPTDPDLRAELEALPTDVIRAELAVHDSVTARREAANRRRLIRALEVVRLTGQLMSSKRVRPFLRNFLILALDPPPDLTGRIERRLKLRIRAGLLDEVRALLGAGVTPSWLDSLGLEYRWISRYLVGERPITIEEVQQSLLHEIVRFAKRQQTFIRTQLGATSVHSTEEAHRLVREFVKA